MAEDCRQRRTGHNARHIARTDRNPDSFRTCRTFRQRICRQQLSGRILGEDYESRSCRLQSRRIEELLVTEIFENGYYAWITDANTTSCTISNGDGYQGGDVGNFSGGQAYYFSVTAIYGEEWQKIAGNAVQVTMPGTPPVATNPAVTITVTPAEGGVNVSWTPTSDATGFVYYKVVASIGTSSPKYPDNGYYAYFEDPNCTSCFIATGSGYNGGDVGTFTSGQAYYFSITACYNEAKTPGNTVQVTMP
jgi:hypothetical protein